MKRVCLDLFITNGSNNNLINLRGNTRRYYMVVCLISMLILGVGCANSKMQTYRSYNALARSVHLSLIHDGYIIGIEKRPRKDVGNPDRFTTLGPESGDSKDTEDLKQKRSKNFKTVTNDSTAMLVTHIYRNPREVEYPDIFYNAYKDYKKEELEYENGYDALNMFKDDLGTRLSPSSTSSSPYTHIIVMSMGWNNDRKFKLIS